ncbi:MAG: 3-methyl-2-oxobutanoate hydroxymethyltransferase [Caulobacterales bacterium]
MRFSIQDLAKLKRENKRFATLTSYDFASAILAERAGAKILLVGDSMGMVVHGHETTLPVTVDDIVRHASAVMRGSQSALVVADMPFLSYTNHHDAHRTAARLMQEAGVQAVKLEGGTHIAPIVKALVANGVPVMGHLGYTPQSTHQIGVKVQAKGSEAARTLIEDALALQEAGAFAIVLELVPAELAAEVTKRLQISTIGIGAGPACDGQVQVWHDVLGLLPGKPPRHAKVFAPIGDQIVAALSAYVSETESGAFPAKEQSASMSPDALAEALKSQ